jgi:hypothetical protein
MLCPRRQLPVLGDGQTHNDVALLVLFLNVAAGKSLCETSRGGGRLAAATLAFLDSSYKLLIWRGEPASRDNERIYL